MDAKTKVAAGILILLTVFFCTLIFAIYGRSYCSLFTP
ncbi:hypothetical protein TMUPMC115_0652 [Tetragenococcus muriaticus PMC-11-5]|uniref:Uncharacterized protein n=1 Tax=Tetragenococcus muriaticus PMC-11-5 TaxID=1302649 RepID=A0A091C9I9_9ENTE|nr:hypothetical protein TMUPMC115_0652 [Tetragenococcus muriaticus PMC-11-5]